MKQASRIGPKEWSSLEELWERARDLTPQDREELLASHQVDDALRGELDALLARASSAEAFFDRLRTAVAHVERADDRSEQADARSSMTAAPDGDPLLGNVVGHYRIVGRLGQGGMGIVYQAVDLQLRRPVALKLLRTHAPHDLYGSERLLVEARAAASLDHANICTIYEVGETTEGVSFIAMAFYSGETLEQVLRRGPLPPSTVLDYATQIARGLGAAHQRGIVHRDVKPANIIVTADGLLKILDFGIARSVDVGAAHENVTPGTLAYMSPEQVTAGALDSRTDLWSLGVVLYEMCTGVRPFAGEQTGAILYSIVHETPAPVSRLRPEIPSHIESIIERLLAKDPAQRYGSAEQLISDLMSTESPRRPSRRSRWIVSGALALGGLLVSWPGPSPPNVSERRLAAQDLYAQGHRDILFRSQSGRRQAMAFFKQATTVDSTYALAHAALAHSLVLTGEDSSGSRLEHLVLAKKSAQTAIRLDSSLADGHAALGHVLLFDYQFAKAEQELKRAVDINVMTPYVRDFLVWLYVFTERYPEALQQAERGAAENPNSPTAIAEVARALLVNGRCNETFTLLGRLAYLNPPPARAAAIAAQCYAQRGMWRQAIAQVESAAERNPLQEYPWLGFMLARSGQVERARQIHDTVVHFWRNRNGGAYGVAVVFAGLRELDSAFVWLDRSIDDRSLRYNIMEPAFTELRSDPRFERVRRRLGLPRP
jgi:serine/threonine protein kinase